MFLVCPNSLTICIVKRKDLFVGIDRDQSGHIHYAEFLAALSESHGLVTMDRLTEVFDRIDTEGKGYITHEDLKSMLGSGYDKETVDKMIKEADANNNGRIDYDELMQLMFSDPVQGDKIASSFDALASMSSHDSHDPLVGGDDVGEEQAPPM